MKMYNARLDKGLMNNDKKEPTKNLEPNPNLYVNAYGVVHQSCMLFGKGMLLTRTIKKMRNIGNSYFNLSNADLQ